MNDGQESAESDELPFYGDHRFLALIIISIVIASILVAISMAIYFNSGAAQLDLSRPGYKDVREQAVSKDTTFLNYSATGVINQTTITEFRTLYDAQAIKAKAIDAFGGDPLDSAALWPESIN